MAITKSTADKKPISPVPGLSQKACRPCACSKPRNCQLSHSKDSTTSGKPKRLTKLLTRPSMELIISKVSTPPHSSVVSTGEDQALSAAMASVPSRITTNSNVVQPIN